MDGRERAFHSLPRSTWNLTLAELRAALQDDRMLMTGLNGTPMVSFADALTPEQKLDVIAWLATLRLSRP